MAYYNLTALGNATNYYEAIIQINNSVGGLFGGLVLLALFMVIFIVMTLRFDPKDAFLSGSFAITVIAAIFLSIGLIGWQIFIYPVILLIASLIIRLWWS